jgi:integrase
MGVLPIHKRGCPLAKAKKEERWASCKCRPSFRGQVWDGQERRPVTKTFPSPQAAATWRADRQAAIRNGNRVLAPVTIGSLWQDWYAAASAGIEQSASYKPYRPSVLRAYETAWRLRLKPAFATVRIDVLTADRVQNYIDDLVRQGLAPHTVNNSVTPLRCPCGFAVRKGKATANPIAGKVLRLPSGDENPRDTIVSPAEALELIDALPSAWDQALWAVALWAGLRRGELLGLRHQDVDLDRRTIHVRRSYDPASQTFQEPKTRRGRRSVGIASVAVPYLERHGASKGDADALVFPGARGPRSPFSPGQVHARAHEAWRAANLGEGLSLHDARHSAASMMVLSGANLKIVSEQLGHSSLVMTADRYSHLLSTSRDEATEQLDGFVSRSLNPQVDPAPRISPRSAERAAA